MWIRPLSRILAFGLLMASMPGCVSDIYPTSEQICANKGMQLDGVDIRQGSAYTSGWRRTYVTDISSVGVRCSRPHDAFEQCKIDEYVKALEPAAEFNATVGRKNLFLALGYICFIAPGVFLYVHYDSDRDHYVSETTRLISSGVHGCEEKMHSKTEGAKPNT